MLVETASPSRSNYNCPISGCLMDRPMTNRVCRHRIDFDSLAHCCQKGGNLVAINCPVYGCVTMWTLSTAVLDVALQSEIRASAGASKAGGAFIPGAAGAAAVASAASANNVVDLTNDDEDEAVNEEQRRRELELAQSAALLNEQFRFAQEERLRRVQAEAAQRRLLEMAQADPSVSPSW